MTVPSPDRYPYPSEEPVTNKMDEAPTDQSGTDEANTAQRWHSTVLTGLIIFCGLYLAAALIPLSHGLVVVGAVGAFVFALGYMGTTIWVYSLRTERKRASKKK